MPNKPRKKCASGKSTNSSKTSSASGHEFRVLLVDSQPVTRQTLTQALEDDQFVLVEAGSLAEARQRLTEARVDVALINPQLPDGSGMELVGELTRSRQCMQTILISEHADVEQAVAAMRLGVCDLITQPFDVKELVDRIKSAVYRQAAELDDRRKVRKLRRLCKQLDEARREVADQVDTLCNDLVAAYQELAMQMQQVVQTSEFSAMARDELDLESLLRKILEFVAQKAGPTNAALFLPATEDEYTLGGYINYDCSADSADLLLQHLADAIAPRIAERDAPVHLTDNATISQWLDGDAAYLASSHLLGVAAGHDGEVLAVLVLFRDAACPFDNDLIDTLSAVAPMLGEYLARIIRVHHRHLADNEYDDGEMLL